MSQPDLPRDVAAGPDARHVGRAAVVDADAAPVKVDANILQQVKATIITRSSFADSAAGPGWQLGLWAIVIAIGVIATISYFFFSAKQKGILKPISRVGIIFVMVGFGASFGYTVMARISLFIGRLQFLLRDWLGIIQ